MIANRNFGQCEPLTWIGQMPVYLSTALAMAHGAALVISALLIAAHLYGVLGAFAFSMEHSVYSYHLWQFATYIFVYNVPQVYLMSAVNIILLGVFGLEVERFIGRSQFAWMYVTLVLGPSVFLMLLGFAGVNFGLLGASGATCFAVFLAFVFIYPRAQVFWGVEARWIGGLLFGIFTLMYLALNDWPDLCTLWLGGLIVLFWMAKEGVQGMSLPSFNLKSAMAQQHSRKHLKVVRREIPAAELEESDVHESIDPILDKIAKTGIGSLTRSERDKLERARAALLEKEGRR